MYTVTDAEKVRRKFVWLIYSKTIKKWAVLSSFNIYMCYLFCLHCVFLCCGGVQEQKQPVDKEAQTYLSVSAQGQNIS